MAVGIPDYRLPTEALLAEIQNIMRAGVEIRCGTSLGTDFTLDDLFEKEDCNAIVLAIGAHKSRKLGIPGEEKAGVLHGTDFLREVGLVPARRRRRQRSCRTSRARRSRSSAAATWPSMRPARPGAWAPSEVHVIYRRTTSRHARVSRKRSRPRSRKASSSTSWPTRSKSLGDGKVTGVVVQRQRLGEFDQGGRRRPVPIEGDTFVLPRRHDRPGHRPDDRHVVDAEGRHPGDRGSTFVVGDALQTSPRRRLRLRRRRQRARRRSSRPWPRATWSPSPSITGCKTGEYKRPNYETPRQDVAQLYNLDDYANARPAARPRAGARQPGRLVQGS